MASSSGTGAYPVSSCPATPDRKARPGRAMPNGEPVALDLRGNVRLVALDEPRSADFDVLVGSGKRPVPGPAAETVSRLENDH